MVNTTASLHHVLIPEFPWIAGLCLFLPYLLRVTQCIIVGTRMQCLNSLRLLTILIGLAFSTVQMPVACRYFLIAADLCSLYWDFFREWQWQRFFSEPHSRRDLPLPYFILSAIYNIIGRCIYIFVSCLLFSNNIVHKLYDDYRN